MQYYPIFIKINKITVCQIVICKKIWQTRFIFQRLDGIAIFFWNLANCSKSHRSGSKFSQTKLMFLSSQRILKVMKKWRPSLVVCFLKGADFFSDYNLPQAFQPIPIQHSSQHLQAVLLLFEILTDRQHFSLWSCDGKLHCK